jgi:hypothetical protein
VSAIACGGVDGKASLKSANKKVDHLLYSLSFPVLLLSVVVLTDYSYGYYQWLCG